MFAVVVGSGSSKQKLKYLDWSSTADDKFIGGGIEFGDLLS